MTQIFKCEFFTMIFQPSK